MTGLRPASRGACPGLSDPMMTGDGLLARLSCVAPIPVAAFIALCEASRAEGNGVIEITQRGNLQFRGLTVTSAPEFARKVSSLGLGGGPTDARVIGNPLSGLDVLEELDTRELQARVRMMADFASLGPKVSVLIDGGGQLHLDRLRADIRLAASGGRFHLALGGDAHSALPVGWLRPRDALEVIARVLGLIAGHAARARDLITGEIDSLRASLAPMIEPGPPLEERPPAEPIGTHALNGARVARGFALPFGHSTAATLQHLALAAEKRGAEAIRAAPGRALLVIGLSRPAADDLADLAAAEDFVVEPTDPRRHVVACTGSPGCSSASLPTRILAPVIAQTAGSLLDGSVIIHLSGCAKGCAHPGRASLTISGPDRVIVDGTAADTAHGTCRADQLVAGLRRLSAERDRQASGSAQLFNRLGPGGVLALLQGEERLG